VHARALHVAAIEQQRDHVQARARVRGVEGDRVLEVVLGEAILPARERFACRAVLDLGGIRDEAVEERAHEVLRLRAHELRHGVAVHERDRVGDRLQAERRHQLRVGVGVDVDQPEAPAVFTLELLQQRAQRPARAAPGRPEVHDHGDFHGAFDHIAFERRQGRIDHGLFLSDL
jgi:hypothetical protein